jgi:hypothetical protein
VGVSELVLMRKKGPMAEKAPFIGIFYYRVFLAFPETSGCCAWIGGGDGKPPQLSHTLFKHPSPEGRVKEISWICVQWVLQEKRRIVTVLFLALFSSGGEGVG